MAGEAKCAVCDGVPAHVDVHPSGARYFCCGCAHCCDDERDAVGYPRGPWVVEPLPLPGLDTTATRAVLDDVLAERGRQHARWGQKDLPDGTGGAHAARMASDARTSCMEAAADGDVEWADVLAEEFWEAMAETDDERLEEELIQVAAVAVQWVEAIRRRRTKASVDAAARAQIGGG